MDAHRYASKTVYFESGIDDEGSWLTIMKEHGIAKVAGAWYSLPIIDLETGKEIEVKKFQSKDFLKILEENSLKDEVYDRICDKVILKYDIKDMDESELVKEVEGDE